MLRPVLVLSRSAELVVLAAGAELLNLLRNTIFVKLYPANAGGIYQASSDRKLARDARSDAHQTALSEPVKW